MIVTSESMYPVLNPNDIIVVKPSKIEEVKEGDIICILSMSILQQRLQI